MADVKDLSFSKRPKFKADKEIILANGTIQKVPYKHWERVIITRPLGETARRAREKKDPDLENIKIGTIPLRSFHEAPIVEEKDKGYTLQPPITPRKDLTMGNLSKEQQEKMGFRRAEHGKGDPR